MARRWYVPLLALPVVIGTVVAVAVGVASASPGLTHTGAPATAAQRVLPGAPMIRPSGVAMPGTGGNVNAVAASPNWAGYAVSSARSGAFRSVSASWVQPATRCKGVAGHRYAAFWVGLDGFNQGDNAVEQTGADSDCTGTKSTYYGWYEMFPAFPVFFRTPIRAGDHMSASVTFSGTETYVLVLRDSTRHWVKRIVKKQANLARSSAEVIAEAPTSAATNSVLPLANFGAMRWTGSKVNGTLLRKIGRRIRINMVELTHMNVLKCLTSPIGSADSFTDRYLRAT